MGSWRGFFISFEGLDGAGKSTQVASLAASLRVRGHDVTVVSPSDTNLGEILHSFVLQHQRGPAVEPWAEALLFNAERAQLLHEIVRPALERGGVVVADRYADSTLAYQGGGRGLPIDELEALHRFACGDVWPDLTMYLRLPLQSAARRRRAQQLPLDRIETAPEEFHARVEAAFERQAAAHPERIVSVDADRPAMAVSREVEGIAIARLPAANRRRAAG
ncbi:MAG: dTMP kinase [Chloroflexi bacterium]|nr:MAG: dTMP kinase [Chloroflexota bacterium]